MLGPRELTIEEFSLKVNEFVNLADGEPCEVSFYHSQYTVYTTELGSLRIAEKFQNYPSGDTARGPCEHGGGFIFTLRAPGRTGCFAKTSALSSSPVIWVAHNATNYLNGGREVPSISKAVRDGRHYIRNELRGTGVLTITQNGQVLRRDTCNRSTGYKWRVEHNPE